jgi:hypothetical protein
MPFARFPSARARRRGAAVAAAGLLALALAGCTGAPTPTPSPTETSAEPIFASDEEALAAAKAAYERYRAISAEISQDGGEEPERIDVAVTPKYAAALHEEFAALKEHGLHMQGTTAIDSLSLAEWYGDAGVARVSLYLCRDVSGTRVIGPDGKDVTPADRPDRTPLVADLVSGSGEPTELVVDGVEKWSGDDFC